MTQRAEEVRALLGWGGTAVSLLDAFEAPVTVFVVVDEDQHRYRVENGLGSMADMALLDRLLDVPYVEGGDEMFAQSGETCQLVSDRGRAIRAPLRIVGAVASGGSWDRVASALGVFVTIAPRVAAVAHVSDRVRVEASVYGIGIVRRDSGGMVSEPLPPVVEVGPFQWYVAELVYAQWLKQSPMPTLGLTPGTAADQSLRSASTPPPRRYTAA